MKWSCLWIDDDRGSWPGISGFLKDYFHLVECANYSEALVQWRRHTFELLMLDLIIPFGAGLPSVEPYLGLTFAEEQLRNGGKKPKVVAFFTVIKDDTVVADIDKLGQLWQKEGIVVEYFNKTEILLSGVEQFIGYLLELVEGGRQ
jgi:hypothetical protein